MHSKILVPLDGSKMSEIAIEQASKMAFSDQVEVRLMVAWEPSATFSAPPGDKTWNDIKEYYQHYLQEWANKLTYEGVKASHTLIEGQPGASIVKVADEEQTDLIVMTSRGRSGLAKLMMGSVAEKVMKDAPCPVLVLGPKYLKTLQ